MGERVSQPLSWVGLGVALGAWLWPWLQPSPPPVLAGILTLAILSAICPTKRCAVWVWLAGGILLGTLSAAVEVGPIPPEEGEYLKGVVVAQTGAWVRIRTHQGIARIHLGPTPPARGDHLALWTRVAYPPAVLPGARDPARNQQRRRSVTLKAREWVQLGSATKRAAGPWARAQHGGVLRALATGDRLGVQSEVYELMRRTGTIHLLAISGLHVGLVSLGVAGLVGLLSRPLVLLGWPWAPRWLALAAATWAAWAYGTGVGWPASAQRAGWVAAAALLGRALGRPTSAWNLLGAAAMVVVLMDPGQVGEIGFQLSFGAVAGILLWAPRVQALAGPNAGWTVKWITSGVGVTIGASIGTLPILSWDLQHLAPVGVLANLIATPLVGSLGVPCALVAAHGPAWLATAALQIGDVSIDLALRMLEMLDVTPSSPATGPLATIGLVVAVMLARWPTWAVALAVACLVPHQRVKHTLTVTFPAVGQGSAALVQWPDGRQWLVDGGPPSDRVLRWLRREGIRRLDTVVLTHPHPDHMGGLGPVLEALEVENLWAPDRPRPDGSAFSLLWRSAAARGTRLKIAGPPGPLVLHPPSDWQPSPRRAVNERSIVLRLTHGRHSFLLTGDIQAEAEALVAPNLPRTTVVQVPHHGSRTSSSHALVAATQPRWAVVSAGPGNPFGHPAPEVIARWGPARTLRTDTDGTLRFETDGNHMSVNRWTPRTGWLPVVRSAVPTPSRPLTQDLRRLDKND